MEIFVIALILFFIYIVVSHIRKRNIEAMTDDEYDLKIHKNEEEMKNVRKKFSSITSDFKEVVKLQEGNVAGIRKNKKELDEMSNSNSNSAKSKEAKNELNEIAKSSKK
tara:strand:+ start:28 stop:354 length:327 start_codon:yes stop_codon:yes gene_type:complete